MLPLATIEQIDRLIQGGELSQRKIAKQLGVSRGTVAAIASGRRGIYGKEPDDETSQSLAPKSPPVRCPSCGFFVYQPCLVCRARDFRQLQHAARNGLAACGRAQSRRAARPSAAARTHDRRRVQVA
jgi:DNA-binding XRE family transcriptional regulator